MSYAWENGGKRTGTFTGQCLRNQPDFCQRRQAGQNKKSSCLGNCLSIDSWVYIPILFSCVNDAVGETRTRTGHPATPSRWCVCQFHHDRKLKHGGSTRI